MKKTVWAACILMMGLVAAVWAEGQPVVAMAAEGKPSFVVVDQVVLNVNAIASAAYVPTSGGGAIISVMYLSGVNSTYPVKISADDWKKIQSQIVNVAGH